MSTSESTNHLKSGNFSVVLKNQKTIEFVVQEVNLPGLNLGEIQVGHWTQNQNRPGDNITWSTLSMTILCDEELAAFKEAFNHIMSLKDPYDGKIEIQNAIFDATLLITTNKNNVQHRVQFFDAWIQSIGDIQFTTTSSEEEQIVFTIELQYDYYKFI